MDLYRIEERVAKSKLLSGLAYPTYHFLHNLMCKIKGRSVYKKNRKAYELKNTRTNFGLNHKYNSPVYTDRYESAGCLSQYFWQDLWAAQLIAKDNPKVHYDIGSRVDGFIANLASFRDNIVLIDVRPLEQKIPGVTFFQADATNLEGVDDNSIDSLSALCSLEHFGLGRYGDPIDPEACFKAFKSIVRVIKVGGHAYIAVPIGKEHVEFDAHRIFYAETIVNEFRPMKLVEYSCIGPREKQIERNVELHKYDDDQRLGGGRFGLFHFVKE